MSWSPGSKLKQSTLQTATGLSRPPHSPTTDLRQGPVFAKNSLWWGRQSYAETAGARQADQ